ncbi:MAG: hypothetical protein HY438_02505 [DPANN group archaeon]|nr:hypothetical protein [DPANN group archaeon]
MPAVKEFIAPTVGEFRNLDRWQVLEAILARLEQVPAERLRKVDGLKHHMSVEGATTIIADVHGLGEVTLAEKFHWPDATIYSLQWKSGESTLYAEDGPPPEEIQKAYETLNTRLKVTPATITKGQAVAAPT